MQTNFSLCSDLSAHFLSIFVLFSLVKRENIGMIPWRAIMPWSVVKISSRLLALSSFCCSGMTIHETKSWLAVTFDNFGRLWLRRECGMVHSCAWRCSLLMLGKLLCAVPLSSGSVGLALFFWSS